MRKAISIFFLGLFLLYHVGYLGYYWYSAQQINDQWMAHVEVTPDMKHVSIPITLPYWNDQSNYRVTHGKIMINGKLYRKVMQKYERDAIHLIVAEDSKTERLNQNIADWVKSMTDAESNTNGKADFIKSVAKDYTISNCPTLAGATESILDIDYSQLAVRGALETFPEISTPPPQG